MINNDIIKSIQKQINEAKIKLFDSLEGEHFDKRLGQWIVKPKQKYTKSYSVGLRHGETLKSFRDRVPDAVWDEDEKDFLISEVVDDPDYDHRIKEWQHNIKDVFKLTQKELENLTDKDINNKISEMENKIELLSILNELIKINDTLKNMYLK